MMSLLSQSLLVLYFFQTFINVCGWGPVGHHIIVRLSQSQLIDSTSEWIRSLTPWHWNGNLSAMASWADDVLYPDTNPTGYGNWQWSRELHYVNIPDWICEYKPERDCINDKCIVGAIKNYTKRLETELDDIQQKEALYFLIHFIGDIHQPLHSSFSSDRGGNSVRGYFMNETSRTNLHTLWDVGLIMMRLRRDFQQNISHYYEHIYQLMLNQSSFDDNDNNVEQWIKENINLVCGQIYFDEHNAIMNASANFTLGEIYYQKFIPIIEQRLAYGGRRLATLLNQLGKNRLQKPSNNKDKLCSNSVFLIIILCVESILAIAVHAIV
ncbi:unnamed protein product [Rotaria sp. Silwood2]|nr:unnamed protein product [Rotaria sp. Silwood2]CAF3074130.1 unnamed protein product [Rotaria sp. Silwood2]CAF3891942.1 unnamed protein product [Rotaria sp. Silwood2]CAF4355585.1 unnamed protein product [Rotaria sp. Silwood2]